MNKHPFFRYVSIISHKFNLNIDNGLLLVPPPYITRSYSPVKRCTFSQLLKQSKASFKCNLKYFKHCKLKFCWYSLHKLTHVLKKNTWVTALLHDSSSHTTNLQILKFGRREKQYRLTLLGSTYSKTQTNARPRQWYGGSGYSNPCTKRVATMKKEAMVGWRVWGELLLSAWRDPVDIRITKSDFFT